MGRGWGVVAEQGSVNSPVERGEGSVYTRKPLRGTCVCVCVCVCERERESAREAVCSQPGLPSQGSGSWLFSGHPHSPVSGSGHGSLAWPCPPLQCVLEAW